MQTDCAQIFFPSDLVTKEGYIIGFNTRGFCFTVLWVENNNNNNITEIEESLDKWVLQDHIQHICGTRLQVLGIISNKPPQQFRDTWLHFSCAKSLKLEELLICGYRYNTKITILLYDSLIKQQLVVYDNQIIPYSEGKLQSIVDCNQLTIFSKPFPEIQKSIIIQDMHELDFALVHINLRAAILREYFNIQQQMLISNNYYKTILQNQALQPILRIVLKICIFQLTVFKYVLKIHQLNIIGTRVGELQFLSNTIKQVKYKYRLISQWNSMAQMLLADEQPIYRRDIIQVYQKLFAGMTFMLMDMIFGILSLLVLYYNVTQLREFIHKYGSSIHIEVLSREVEWLMGFPMGLKTNKPLNWVLGQLIMYIIVFWDQITTFITPYETYLLRITLVFCLFGFTFELALAIDIISLCTIHVYYIYKVLLYTYRQIIHVTLQFYRITKNKFMNTITGKLEDTVFSWERKISAMFMGFFLLMMLPTVSLYYFWFLLIVILIYLTKLTLTWIQQLFSRFPLYLIYTYYNEQTIPKSIELVVREQAKDNQMIAQLQYKKMPLSAIINVKKLIKMNKNINIKKVLELIFMGQDIMIRTATINELEIKENQTFDALYKI